MCRPEPLRSLLLAAWVFATAACSRSEPGEQRGRDDVCDAIDLLGHRTKRVEHNRCVPVFDPERRPRILASGFEVRLDRPFDGLGVEPQAARVEVVGNGHVRCEFDALAWTGTTSIEAVAKAHALRTDHRPAEARKTLEAAEAHASPWERVWIRSERARTFPASGQWEASIRALSEARDAAKAESLTSEAARLALSASYSALMLRRVSEGLEWVERAERDLAPCPDPEMDAWVEYHRALLLERRGDHRQARNGFERAAFRLEGLGLTRQAQVTARHGLAEQLFKLGQLEQALAVFAQIEDAMLAHPKPTMRGAFLNGLGELTAVAHPDDPEGSDRARTLLRRAVDVWEKAEHAEGQALSLYNLAYLEHDRGNPEASRRLLDRADATKAAPHGLSGPRRQLLRAELHLQKGRLTQAVERFRAVLEHETRMEPGHASKYTWRAHHGLARAAKLGKDGDLAWQELQIALEHRRRASAHAAIRDQQPGLLARSDALFREAIEWALERDDPATAFRLADERAAEILGAIDTQLRWSRLDPARQRELERRVDAYREAWARFEEGRSEGSELTPAERKRWSRKRRAERRRLAQRFDALFAWLDRNAPPLNLGIESLEMLRASLEPDEAIFWVDRIDGAWFAFWVTRDTLQIHRPDSDEDALRPFESQISEIGHLYLVGRAAFLHELAHRTTRYGDLLLRQVSMSHLPHAGVLTTPDPAPTGETVVVADPEGDLPHARDEARQIAERLRSVRTLIGPAATRQAVLDALSGASVLHFAGHGRLTPSDPWSAHLRLAREERMTLDDILIQRLPLRLAVLSGCETGQPMKLSSRDGVGLADALLAAGARSVLATVRPIRDDEAVRFMERFYSYEPLESPADALRKAALADAAAGGETWRAFRLYGRR